jgi:hypothetical protein
VQDQQRKVQQKHAPPNACKQQLRARSATSREGCSASLPSASCTKSIRIAARATLQSSLVREDELQFVCGTALLPEGHSL